MSFRDCVSAALNDGQISREDAEKLIQRFSELEADPGVNGFGRKGPKAELANELRAAANERRRVAGLAEQATRAIERDVRRYALLRGQADIVGAANSLFENFGHAGFSSVRGIYNALLGEAHAGMAEALHDFRRSALTLRRFNRPLLDDVPKAAFGHEAPEEARAFYREFQTQAERLREKFNAAGGDIKELKDWGLPQSHNAGAVLHAGFEKWSADIEPRLDWDRMEHSISGAKILPGERQAVLRHVFNSIATDGWNTREPAYGGGGVALYNSRADARFLRFKGPDDWLAYNRAYGSGDVFATMMSHIRSMARDVALMQRLGPNPAATVGWLKQLITQEGARMKMGEPSLFPSTKPLLVNARVLAANHLIDGFYDVARGVSAPFSRFGAGMGIARNIELSAKHGGAVILHTFANPVIQGMGRHLQGHPMLAAPIEVLKNLTHDRDLAQAGMILEDAMHTLERGAREQGAMMKAREWSNWLPKITAHYSGLEAMVEANRRAAFAAQMANYANHLDRDFVDLPPRLRAVLEGYGLDGQDWAVMRQATPHEPTKGAPILRFQDIAAAPGVDPAAAQRAAFKYLELLHQSTEVLVPSQNWRLKAATAPLAREGTLVGEVVRSALMFKSGFMATFMLTQAQGVAREIANHGAGAAAAYVGASMIALTAAGMVVLQAKNLRAGKDLRSMDPTTKEGREAWEHAFLTSGALGIYGDFIASDRSSYGHEMLSTVLGPIATSGLDLVHSAENVGLWALHKTPFFPPPKPDKENLPGREGLAALRNNTPMLSTHWALSAAYNRVILDQLQYMADPAAHQAWSRAQQRLRKDTGQRYFWPPGQALPGRLPAIAGGR